MNVIKFFILFLVCAFTAHAQLVVNVLPVKTVGQKAIAMLAITNNLAVSIASARAVCFLVDEQGKMVGQSSRWVIGGTKDRSELQPKTGTTFNFIITSSQPLATNITAKISFSRIVLVDGKQADVKYDVLVRESN
jgi:hypothetical protein